MEKPRRGYRAVAAAWIVASRSSPRWFVLAWRHFEDVAPGETKPGGGGRAGRPVCADDPRRRRGQEGDIPLTVDALGVVTSLATVTVRTQIAGALQQNLGFKEGQIVKAGDFSPRSIRAPCGGTRQAQGHGPGPRVLAQAETDLARYQPLSKQDSIARQQVEQAARFPSSRPRSRGTGRRSGPPR